MKSYEQVKQFNSDIKLFILKGSKRGIWWYEFSYKNNRERVSTKTDDFDKASRIAFDAYQGFKLRHDHDMPLKSGSFETVARNVLGRLDEFAFNGDQLETYSAAIEDHLIPYFGSFQCDKIKRRNIDNFAKHKLRQKKKGRDNWKKKPKDPYSARTVNGFLTVFRFVMEQAAEMGHVHDSAIPYLKNLKLDKARKRIPFKPEEIAKIKDLADEEYHKARIRALPRLQEQGIKYNGHEFYSLHDKRCRQKFLQRFFIKLSIACGARPSTLMRMTFGQIKNINEVEKPKSDQQRFFANEADRYYDVAIGEEHKYERMLQDDLKRDRQSHLERVADMPDNSLNYHPETGEKLFEIDDTAEYYLYDLKSNKGEAGHRGNVAVLREGQDILREIKLYQDLFNKNDNEKIFESSSTSMCQSFERFVSRHGLRYSTDGDGKMRSRGAYSLRHYYITKMIKKGKGLGPIALNTFTTIEMLQDHYFEKDNNSLLREMMD